MRTDRRAVHRLPRGLRTFVIGVVTAGVVVIAHSAAVIDGASINAYALLLAALTIVSGRFAIKVPGRSATVSVSEVFVFSSILLCGAPLPVLTIALDGLWSSLTQRNRRWYRALFNAAEPAISTWAAAQAFFLVAGVLPGSALSTDMPMLVPATFAMAAVFFALNSGLSALAVALESEASAYQIWRSHAVYLAVNYYSAASLATMAIGSGTRINFSAAVLAAPLLVLSYVAYREASSRADETRRHVADVERLYRASVEMLAIAVDTKDQVTHGHIRRVQRHTMAVASALGVSDVRELKAIEAGALLHDIGKLAVPDYVLNKPSALTRSEFETMKKHASMGARILTAVDFPYPIVPIVRHHHEQWNGGGYPDGLVGAEIPLGARILSVVDCFDALTSDRPYRPRLTDDQAVAILRSRSATFYDPAVVEKFVELIPDLRKGDEVAGDRTEGRAAVVAGLTRAGSRDTRLDEAAERTHTAMPAVPSAAAKLIDAGVDHLDGEACLYCLDAAQEKLLVGHATARLREAVARIQIPVGSGVSGWVAANRSAIRRADPVLDVGELANAFALRSCISVPVFSQADLFGVLTIYVPGATCADETVAAAGLLAQEVGLIIARGTRVESGSRSPQRLLAVAVS
jgi:putative nucleotidyltransferase with HDIG domain